MDKLIKIYKVLLIAILSIALVGCNSNVTDNTNKTETEIQDQEINTNKTETEIQDGAFPYTFTDVLGREITIDEKPETFIVGNYILNFMLIGGSESLDKVVGLPLDGWDETRYGEYTSMSESFPEILEKVNIGGYHDDVLDSELILNTNPDVLLINTAQYTENETSIPTFEKAGIHVIVLDYHKMKIENHIASTEIIGVLLGREDVASEMIEEYSSGIEMVQSRVAEVEEKDKPSIYMELGNKGIAEYGNSYAGCLWGAIINNTNSINIADEVLSVEEGYGPLDKEYVYSKNPDIIIIGGSIWTGNTESDQMRMGLTVENTMSQERLEGFTKRTGWSELKAVQNGEVYGVDHGSLRFMGDYIYTKAIAKISYPELFNDVDPQLEMEEFYAKYLPELNCQGTFFVKLSE